MSFLRKFLDLLAGQGAVRTVNQRVRYTSTGAGMKVNMSGSSTVHVNGRTYVGNSVSIIGNKVYIDGKLQEGDANGITDQVINVTIEGNCTDVQTDQGDIEVRGSVTGNVKSSQGNITCGNVGGDVKTSQGNIHCGDVKGDVKTSMGNINRK